MTISYRRGGSGGETTTDTTARASSAANTAALNVLTPKVIDAPNISTDDTAKTVTFPLNSGGNKVVDIAGMFAGLTTVPETAAQTTYDNVTSALAANNVQAALDELAAAQAIADTAINAEAAARAAADALKADKTELHDGAMQDAAIALREVLANKQTTVRATGTATDTAYTSEKAVRDALDFLASKKVRNFSSYGEANAEGPQPRDTIFIIGMKKEAFARSETTGSFVFPGTGEPDANWFRIGDSAPDPQSLLLDYILVNVRSSGTNAGSSISVTFTDNDGNDYPHTDWLYSADLLQYAGGSATLITDKVTWSGTLGIGRNKEGPIKFYYIGENPNGISAIAGTGANNGVTQDVAIEYQGTNYSDTFASTGAVSGPLYWTTSQQVEPTDQAAPLVDATEYTSGSVFSNPEPDNTDPDYLTWFNWRVNDGETIADTDVPNGTEAEFLAIKSKLTRFGVGSKPDISLGYLSPVDQVVSAPDPIPTVGAANTRFMYMGVTTSSIYEFDNAGANPIVVTNPGAADWANGVLVDDLATSNTYRYDRATNNFTLVAQQASTKWQYSTDGMNAVDGDKIIVAPNHTINITDTTDLASIEFAPSTGNWADIQAGTGSFSPDVAWTFGAGQTLPYGSDVLRVVSNLGNTNWLLFTGGEDAPSQDQRYATVPDLPAIATVNPGAMGVVYNDPTPANNRTYIARTDGVTANVAVAWA